jgi:tetratricopeptide (TPR) repeat protein
MNVSAGPEVLEQIQELQRRRAYEALLIRCNEELGRAPGPDLAAALHTAKGDVLYELGKFGEAAEELDKAADARAAAGDSDESVAWLRARALESGFRATESEAELTNIRQRVSDEIADSSRSPAATAAFRWARGRLLSGPRPDDRPSSADLHRAELDLQQATNDAPARARVRLALARVMRLRVRLGDTPRAEDIRTARRYLDACDDKVGELEDMGPEAAKVALEYEAGRLALAEQHFKSALESFERVRDLDPGHQGANVWLIHTRWSVKTQTADKLLAAIDRLFCNPGLRRSNVTPAVDETPTGQNGRSGAVDGAVVNPDLEAQLLTVRATILETLFEYEAAAADYRTALERRPRMLLAHRGIFRCLLDQGLYEAAEAKTAEIESLVDPLTADLLVELGTLPLNKRQFGEALQCFQEAQRISPEYGLAYVNELTARRGLRRQAGVDEAIARAEEALRQHGESLFLPNAVRVGIGQSHLSLAHLDRSRTEDALQLFREAAKDQLPDISDLARAGIIDALRLARRLEDAAAEAAKAPAGPRVCAAAGWLHGELGELGRALGDFEQGLERNPGSIELVIGRVRVLRLLGRPTDARRHLGPLVARLPEHVRTDPQIELGWTYIELEKLGEASDCFQELPEAAALRGRLVAACRDGHHSGSELELMLESLLGQLEERPDLRAWLLVEAGRCALRRGDPLKAREHFDEAKDGSVHPLLRVSIGECFLDHRAISDAEAMVDEVESMYDGRYRDDPAVCALRARCHYAAGNPDVAADIFRDLLDRSPGSEPVAIGSALATFGAGDMKAACTSLQELVESNPKNLTAAEELAWLLVSWHELGTDVGDDDGQDLLTQAAKICERVRAEEPRAAGVYRCLAAIARHRDRLPQAELYLRQAERMRPTDPEVACDRGALFLAMHRYREAEGRLKKALKLDPENARAYFVLGALHLERGEPLPAAACFKQSGALLPAEPAAHTALATALIRADREEDALAAVDRGLTLTPKPKCLDLRVTKARALYELARERDGDSREVLLKEALQELNRAGKLARAPKERARVHYHTGVIQHAQGNPRSARHEFKAAEKNDEDLTDAKRAQNLVRAPGVDRTERLTQRAGYALGILGLILIIFAVAVGLLEGSRNSEPDIFDPSWFPVVAALLGAMLLGGVLPRLAGLKFRGMELAVAPLPTVPEAAPVTLDFGPVPLLLMSGSMPYQPSGPIADRFGDPAGPS